MASTVAHALGFHPESLKLDSQAKYGALARGDAQAWMRFPPATYRCAPQLMACARLSCGDR